MDGVTWQPIETYRPGTDPREVLLWVPLLDFRHIQAIHTGDKWVSAWDGARLVPEPTHWMPLPEPPQPAE